MFCKDLHIYCSPVKLMFLGHVVLCCDLLLSRKDGCLLMLVYSQAFDANIRGKHQAMPCKKQKPMSKRIIPTHRNSAPLITSEGPCGVILVIQDEAQCCSCLSEERLEMDSEANPEMAEWMKTSLCGHTEMNC